MYNINYFCAMPYISLYETTPESVSRDDSIVVLCEQVQYKLPFYVNKYNTVQYASRDHFRGPQQS